MTDLAKLLSMSFSTRSMAPCRTDVASMGAGAGSDGSEKSLWGVARPHGDEISEGMALIGSKGIPLLGDSSELESKVR